MTENVSSDHVTVRIPCQHCGEVASLRMTPEAARRHAQIMLAAADGLEALEVEVRGEG